MNRSAAAENRPLTGGLFPPAALVYLAGVSCTQFVSKLPDLNDLLLMTTALAVFGIAYKKYQRQFFLLLFFIAGLVSATWQGQATLDQRLPDSLAGQSVIIQGIVASISEKIRGGVRFEMEVAELSGERLPADAMNWRGRLRLNWYATEVVPQPGQVWRFMAKLRPPRGMVNPGAFDYEGWLFSHGIHGTGYVLPQELSPLLVTESPWRFPVQRARDYLLTRLQEATAGLPNAGILAALAVGNQSSIKPAQWKIISATGTNHLLAISGLHIGLVGGFCYFLFQWLWRRSALLCRVLPAPIAAALLAMLPVLAYVALSGFAVPARRATIMFVVPVLVLLFRGKLEPGRMLSVALFLVLLIDPISILQAGFWLSFGAVGLILWAMTGGVKRSGYWWWGKIQIWIGLGLIPLLLLLYQKAPLLGIPANLVAVPAVSLLVVPITLVGTLMLPISSQLASSCFMVADFLMDILWWFLAWLAGFSNSWSLVAAPPVWAVIMGAIGLALLLAPRGLPARWLGLAWCLPLFFYTPEGPQRGQFEFTLLDVGQGLCAVVRTSDSWLVFDTGAAWSERFSAAQGILLPYLRSRGAKRIDSLILSHADQDHIGEYKMLVEEMAPMNLWSGTPELLDSPSTATPAFDPCEKGVAWERDGVKFAFLNLGEADLAQDRNREQKNNRSCVLRVEGHSMSLLLTGDIEKAAEQALLQQHEEQLDVDVLVVPHHGSRTSSSWPFLDRVSPKLALISSGYLNRFHHPAADVVARYRQIDSQVMNTAETGAIQILTQTGREPLVSSWRDRSNPYWRHRLTGQ